MKRQGTSFLWSGTREAARNSSSSSASLGPGSPRLLAETERRVSKRSSAGFDMGSGEVAKVGFPSVNSRAEQWRILAPRQGTNGPARLPKSASFTKEFALEFGALETGITARGRLSGTNAMRGKTCAGLRLLLLPAAL